MRVTIILDSGGFLVDECKGQTCLEVGYFETAGTSDIEVFEGGILTQLPKGIKLGTDNKRIHVQHVADGALKNDGVKLSPSFKKDILKKKELYPNDPPEYDLKAYDCIFRFESGEFESSCLKSALFKEHRVKDKGPTGNSQRSRLIAHDVLVNFDLGAKEELRLRKEDGSDLWSSSSVGSTTTEVAVKILADNSTVDKYFRKALKLKGQHYHQPNPDPPPMNGNEPDPGFS